MNQLVYIFFLLICLSRLFLYLILYIFRITIITFWFSAMFSLKRHLKTQRSPVILDWFLRKTWYVKEITWLSWRHRLRKAPFSTASCPVSPGGAQRIRIFFSFPQLPALRSRFFSRYQFPLAPFCSLPVSQSRLETNNKSPWRRKRFKNVFCLQETKSWRFRKAPFSRWTSMDCAYMKAWKTRK